MGANNSTWRGRHDLECGGVVGLEPCRIEADPDLAALAADDGELGYVLVLLDLRAELEATRLSS